MPAHQETKTPKHQIARPIITLGGALFLALIIAAWEFIGLRAVNPDRPLAALESPPVPWGGLAGREAARFLGDRWRLNPGAAAAPLLAQLGHYPLDPWRWLLFSRIRWNEQRDAGELRRNLAAAISVQPHNREIRWQAANLAQSTGDSDLVLDQIAQWLADEPRDTARALFIAGRWAEGDEALLDRVLPDEEAFLAEAMEYARRSHDVALAQAVWQRLEQPRDPQDEAFADYVATALNNARPDLAMQAWQAVDPGYRPGDIPAGDLAVPLAAMATFGWNLRMPDGVEVEGEEVRGPRMEGRGPSSVVRGPETGGRGPKSGDVGRGRVPDGRDKNCPRGLDACETEDGGPRSEVGGRRSEFATDFDQNANPPTPRNERTNERMNERTREAQALRITFNGEQNIHLAAPSVRFPVPEPGRYRLTGWWRAEGLTTRSLPYLQLYAESSDHRFSETAPVPGQDFDWQRFEIPFEVRETNELFALRLRRNRTDAFDRYISGALWLAGLRVQEVELGIARADGKF